MALRYIGLALVAACHTPTPARTLVVRSGRVFDGTQVLDSPTRITVTDGDIVRLEPDTDQPVPAGSRVIDARQHTVMPGLINAHAHVFLSGSCSPGVGQGLGQTLRNLHSMLAAGVTTVADLGSPVIPVIGLRRYIGTGRSRGPRLFASGPAIVPTGGVLTNVADGELVKTKSLLQIASAPQARQAVRSLVEADVDLIKVSIQRQDFDLKPLPTFSPETLCAVVDEAHAQEMRVLAHAVGAADYNQALECGVDGIVHAALEPLNDATFDRIAQAAIPVAPTLFVFEAALWGPEHPEWLEGSAAKKVLDDETRADLQHFTAAFKSSDHTMPPVMVEGIPKSVAITAGKNARNNTGQLAERNVPLAAGTDSGVCFVFAGALLQELLRLESLGLSPVRVLQIATGGSARMLNLHDALAKVAVGYRADLIVVAGKPDQHLPDLENIETVIIDGVVQRPSKPGLWNIVALTWHLLLAYLGG